jgi:hypothetical protein
MSNCYKNIIKNFAHKLNEQQMPKQEPEETVELTQAKNTFDFENPPATVELENGKILKYVSSLADQVKGKVKHGLESYKFISVYVDDSNKKYIVYDWDEDTYGPIADLGAESWTKRFESGALPPNAIEPYWYDIINHGNTLEFLDSNAAETIAKAIASLKLDAKQAKQTAEALWGDNTSFVDIMSKVSVDNNLEHEFLTSDTDDFHDTIKGYENDTVGALRYEFEV